MTTNNITTVSAQQTMTSLDIAEITGKNHFDVLKAIRKMEPAWEKVAASKFACSEYEDKSGKKNPMYILTKTETLFIATKFNDEARAKLVLRWEQLETERRQQQPDHSPVGEGQGAALSLTRKQILLMALEAEQKAEEAEQRATRLQEEVNDVKADFNALAIQACEQNLQLDKMHEENRQLRERNSYLDVIMADNTTVTVTQIAQDYGMSAVALNNLLKGLRIQRRVGEQWVLYADYLGKGLVATRMIPIHHAGRPDTFKPTTNWTQRGRRFIYDALKRHGVLPLIERTETQKGGQS